MTPSKVRSASDTTDRVHSRRFPSERHMIDSPRPSPARSTRRPRLGPVRACLRAVRRWLRSIDAYAAPLPGDPWNRVRRGLILASPAAALLFMLAAEALVIEERVQDTRLGVIVEPERGPPWISTEVDSGGRLLYPPAFPSAEFELERVLMLHGWPLVTRTRGPVARLRLTRFPSAEVTVHARLAPDDPLLPLLRRTAAADAEFARSVDVLAPEAVPARGRIWSATVYAVLLTGFVIAAASSVAVTVLRAGWTAMGGVARARRLRRQRRNRCGHCDYDVRGLEFHARCPECGRLLE